MSVKSAFLSSTSRDLQKYRDAVRNLIDTQNDWNWDGMERFTASPDRTADFCRERVKKCDVLVGILGPCYGSCPRDSELSYTEIEYNAADEYGKDCLMFLSRDNFFLPEELKESPEKGAKQSVFRKHVADHVCNLFLKPDELAGQVLAALTNWEGRKATEGSRPPTDSGEIMMPLAAGPPTGRPWEEPPTRDGQIVPGLDEGELVGLKPGEFKMGAMWKGARENERPVHVVHITHAFWVGRRQVTNYQYANFLNDVGYELDSDGHVMDTHGQQLFNIHSTDSSIELTDDGLYRPIKGRQHHPVVSVNWYGAMAYAKHHKMRLPTEAEWEYVARGPRRARPWVRNKYPWGDKWDWRKCCNEDNKPNVELLGKTRPVGSFPTGASWCGALDMAGNVWECCADWHNDAYYKNSPRLDPQGPDEGTLIVVRGGSWYYGRDWCTTTHRHGTPPDLTNNSLGFRCAVTPKPESANRPPPGQ